MNMKFKLAWIIAINSSLVNLIRQCFPQTSIYTLENVLWQELLPVDIIGLNGPMVGNLFTPAFGSLLFFDWDFRPSRRWKSWKFVYFPLQHVDCGGVTSFYGDFKLGIHTTTMDDFRLPDATFIQKGPKADLGSILSCREHGKTINPLVLEPLPSPIVTYLDSGLLHPRGLLPWDAQHVICS